MTKASRTPETPKSRIATVDLHLDTLQHTDRALIDALRGLIAAAVPDATESIKWNAPSFAKSEHFATLNLRAKQGVQLVMHLGAKPRTDVDMRTVVGDDAGLLDWKSADRAIVSLRDVAHLDASRETLGRIVSVWSNAVV